MCFFNKTSQTRRQVSSGHFGNTRVRWRQGTEKYNQCNYDKKSTTSDAAKQCLCCGERSKLSKGKFGTKICLNKLRNAFFKKHFFKDKVYKNTSYVSTILFNSASKSSTHQMQLKQIFFHMHTHIWFLFFILK